MQASLGIGESDSHRLRHLGHRQAFHVTQDDDGPVLGGQVVDRRVQRGAQVAPKGGIVETLRPVGDRRRTLSVVVERRQHLLQRDLGPMAGNASQFLAGGVRDDPVEPRPEGGITSKRVDLPDHAPERILHDLLGIRGVACDPDRQAIRAATVPRYETLRGGWIMAPQRLEERTIAIVWPLAGTFGALRSETDRRMEIVDPISADDFHEEDFVRIQPAHP